MSSLICAYGIVHLVRSHDGGGTTERVANGGSHEEVPNPRFVEWKTRDALLVNFSLGVESVLKPALHEQPRSRCVMDVTTDPTMREGQRALRIVC